MSQVLVLSCYKLGDGFKIGHSFPDVAYSMLGLNSKSEIFMAWGRKVRGIRATLQAAGM